MALRFARVALIARHSQCPLRDFQEFQRAEAAICAWLATATCSAHAYSRSFRGRANGGVRLCRPPRRQKLNPLSGRIEDNGTSIIDVMIRRIRIPRPRSVRGRQANRAARQMVRICRGATCPRPTRASSRCCGFSATSTSSTGPIRACTSSSSPARPRHRHLEGGGEIRRQEALIPPPPASVVAPVARRVHSCIRHRGRVPAAHPLMRAGQSRSTQSSSHDRCLLASVGGPVFVPSSLASASRLHPRSPRGGPIMCSRHVTWCALHLRVGRCLGWRPLAA